LVFDQVHQTAVREANRLRCRVAESVWQLLSWPGLDGVLYCDEQWFGLWPLELVASLASSPGTATNQAAISEKSGGEGRVAKKQVWWSLVAPTVELSRASTILERIVASRQPVHFVWPEWEVKAAQMLCRHAVKRLGILQWTQIQYLAQTSERAAHPLVVEPDQAFRFWCGALLWLSRLTGESAEEVHRLGSWQDEQTQYRVLVARFPRHGLACLEVLTQVNGDAWNAKPSAQCAQHASWARSPLQVRIVGTHGEAFFRWPDRIDWYVRPSERSQRCYDPLCVEERLLRRWLKQQLGEPTGMEELERLKHYCALLQRFAEA
jgi:hypothetical protein